MLKIDIFNRCGICQGGQTAAAGSWLGKIKGYDLYGCPECRLIYVFPKQSLAELSDFYLDYHEQTNQYGLSQSGEQELFRTVLESITDQGASGELLDIGASYGHFLALARDFGFHTKGLDIAPEPCRYAREELGLDVDCQSLAEARFPENRFSVITMLNVLEHVPDPQAVLEESWRIAQPGAFLVVVVPNYLMAFPYFRLTRKFGLEVPVPTSAYAVPDHLSIFAAGSLRRMLAASGWNSISIGNAPVIRNESAVKNMAKRGVKSLGDLLFRLTAGRLVYGYSLLAVCRKPRD